MKIKWQLGVRTVETQLANAELKPNLLIGAGLFSDLRDKPGVLCVLGKCSPLSYIASLLFDSLIWRGNFANLFSLTGNL